MSKKVAKLRISSRLLKKRNRRRGTLSIAKQCRFCSSKEQLAQLDYKSIGLLRSFLTERGKILPARISGVCNKHQRSVAQAIKKARIMALVAYCSPNY